MQRVKIGDIFSNFSCVCTGTPQRGVISPIIFAFIISTLVPISSNCKFIKYVDDLTIISVSNNFESNHLQQEMDHGNAYGVLNII